MKKQELPDESTVELENRLKAVLYKVKAHLHTLYNTFITGQYHPTKCRIIIGIYNIDFYIPLTPETLSYDDAMAGLRNALIKYKKLHSHFGKLDGILYAPKEKN